MTDPGKGGETAGEFQRIARLSRVFGQPAAPSLGIGDDCAVLSGAGDVVVTVDASVEGVHFTRSLLPLDGASARAVEAALSDVAAMGARVDVPGTGVLLAWTLPADLSLEDLDALADGAARAAARVGTVIVGGNLTRGPVITLTTTVFARATGGVVTRAGARPGDVLAVTGVVGAAGLGLRALQSGRGLEAACAGCVRHWQSPRARLDLGRAALGWAHAMIDISDGLAQDAGHLADASGCQLQIESTALPLHPAHQACAARLGVDATTVALSGGEDYELLATGPREGLPAGWTVIGTVEAGTGVVVLTRGVPRTVTPGWDHFGQPTGGMAPRAGSAV